MGPEVSLAGQNLNFLLQGNILDSDADVSFYNRINDLSSLIANANNSPLLEVLMGRVSDLRDHMKNANRWSVSAETDLRRLEIMISIKMDALNGRNYRTKLVDYLKDVDSDDMFLLTKSPNDMSTSELVLATIDKLAYEVHYFGNVSRAAEVLTDKVAVGTIISYLGGYSSNIIIEKVTEQINKKQVKDPSPHVEKGLLELKGLLLSMTRVTKSEVSNSEVKKRSKSVNEPASITEALDIASDISVLMDEFPEVFSSKNILDFVTGAEALPKAQALNVLTQANLMIDLSEFSASTKSELEKSISKMGQKIIEKDKDILVKRILNFYNTNWTASPKNTADFNKDQIIEGFKDYLLFKDCALEALAGVSEIVFGTFDRGLDDALLAYKGNEQKDGMFYLLLLGNNPTIIFDGKEVALTDFLANTVNKKSSDGVVHI